MTAAANSPIPLTNKNEADKMNQAQLNKLQLNKCTNMIQ